MFKQTFQNLKIQIATIEILFLKSFGIALRPYV